MKRIAFYLTSVLILSLAFCACSKDDNDDDDNNDSGNNNESSYVSFTMDDTTYTLNNVGPVVVSDSYIQLTATGKDDNDDDVQLQIHVDSSAEMTYDAGHVIFDIDVYSVDSSLHKNYGADINLTFTETSTNLEGTFSGTFVKKYTADPPTKEVTNGVIFVKSEEILRY
jgi:hypothetical protein